MSFAPGQTLRHYRIVEKLGAGGMGEVWLAEDTRLGREVALKRLPEALAHDPSRLERFQREARTLAALAHPGIVTIHAVEESDAGPFLAMERVRGATLGRELPERGLPPAQVLELAIAIADALAAAHERGIVHRDLKPDNIMLADDGRVRVLDFGLATATAAAPVGTAATSGADAATVALGEYTTQPGTILGTVAYMSPEQALGRPADARSDVFSLGVVVYELASGRRPFAGGDPVSLLASILRDTPPPCDRLNPDVPSRLAAIVQRCLEKDPAARYADGGELRDALRGLRDWARGDGAAELAAIVDRIQGLEEGPEAYQAWLLGHELAKLVPADPMLARLSPIYERAISITSAPPGARVAMKWVRDGDDAWRPMGVTPLEAVAWPKGFTRVRVEADGLAPMQDLVYNLDWIGATWHFELAAPGTRPPGMELVPAGAFPLFIPGLDHLELEPLDAFLMDRDPVTHREFKYFVDAGGYANADWWREPFVDAGRTLARDEAMARFVDATGRPGPAGWEMGGPAPGEDDLPVSGVSWYEAAAYAAWAGKSLPTIFHWNRVAFTPASAHLIAAANLHGRGPVRVGSTASVNRFGVRDLAGNVREWQWNARGEGDQRFILGGGWNDVEYSFNDAWAVSAFDRSETNGFRCIREPGDAAPGAPARRVIDVPVRDFRTETPVPDAVFEFFVRQFRYDATPLAASIDADGPTPLGRMQTVTFAAAYGGERMTAYVWLPDKSKPPYQVFMVFPGSNAIHTRVFNPLDMRRVDFVVRSGRALVLPVYKGTYHRGGDLHSDYPTETAAYRDYVIAWVRDFGRTLDYLATRGDMDLERVGYFGLSWGGFMGAIVPAVERRIRANVLYVAGLCSQRSLPEVEALNYAPRVTQPTLMLNAEHDFFFPPETSQKPMFDLLGAPPEHKKRLTWPGGHSVPRTEMIKETLGWLDRYLGPVG